MGKATKQNKTKEGFTGSLFVKLVILLLVLTGMLFWFPAFFQFFGRRSMEIAHLHITLGLILIIAGIVAILRQRKKRAAPIKKNIKHESNSASDTSGPGKLPVILRICLSLMVVTGLGLTFAQFVPRKMLMVLMYLHGTGAFILIIGIAVVGFQKIAEKLTKPSAAVETDDWYNHIDNNRYKLRTDTPADRVGPEEFLETFGTLLKYSKLKIFLHDYMQLRKSNNIFADEIFLSGQHENFSKKYSPSDYLMSVYYKYFTFSGWLHGWFSSGRGLTDLHVNRMAALFFSYIPGEDCNALDIAGCNETLFAEYGRFILRQMGFALAEEVEKETKP